MIDLGAPNGSLGTAYGINAAGQVVGAAQTSGGGCRAFLYSPGAGMKDIGSLGGSRAESWAYHINATGQVVGYSITKGRLTHAFLYSDRTGMRDLGTLGGDSSSAYRINDGGLVVGRSATPGGATHAFLYENGAMKGLGTLGGPDSVASGVNAGGQVVGTAQTAEHTERAFVYDRQNGVLTDLNSLVSAPGWTLNGAMVINDAGQIAGYGTTPEGNIRAYLLTPVPKTSNIGPNGGRPSSQQTKRR